MRQALYEARKRAGMTQQQLAMEAALDRTVYNRIERGLRNPGVEVAIKIAAILKKSVEDIFLPCDALKKHNDHQEPRKIRCKGKAMATTDRGPAA